MIRLPDHPGVITQQMQKIPQPQTDFQIELAFSHTCAGGGTAILPAVTGIDDNALLPRKRTVLGKYGNCSAAAQHTGQKCRNDGKIAEQRQTKSGSQSSITSVHSMHLDAPPCTYLHQAA